MIGPRAPDLTPKPSDTKPITATSLAKDQRLDEILKKLDNGGGLDALLSCEGLGDLQQSSVTSQFLSFFRWMISDLFFYCMTVKPIYYDMFKTK